MNKSSKNFDYNVLKLDNQLCFPLYAASREIIKKYHPYLSQYDLTYTQYLVLLVLWENKVISSKELGAKLYLDSGTLTPVLKQLETKKYLTKERDVYDSRNLVVKLTESGDKLKDRLKDTPIKIEKCLNLDVNEEKILYNLLYKVLKG